jgi:hypothetical protein
LDGLNKTTTGSKLPSRYQMVANFISYQAPEWFQGCYEKDLLPPTETKQLLIFLINQLLSVKTTTWMLGCQEKTFPTYTLRDTLRRNWSRQTN